MDKITRETAERQLDNAINELRRAHITEASIKDFKANLMPSITNAESPDLRFDHLGEGSFKECYDSGIGDWVVKFCTEKNHTDAEMYILQCAEKVGLEDLFLRTYKVDLPALITSEYIDYEEREDENGNWDYYPPNLDCFLIQEKCHPLETYKGGKYADYGNQEAYEKNPIPGVTWDEIDECGLQYLEWIRRVYEFYGSEYVRRFIEFLRNHDIGDLHSGNIGFSVVTGHPVILDWMSGDRGGNQ